MERYNYLVQNKRGTYLHIYNIFIYRKYSVYTMNVFLKLNFFFFLTKDRLQYLETSKGIVLTILSFSYLIFNLYVTFYSNFIVI